MKDMPEMPPVVISKGLITTPEEMAILDEGLMTDDGRNTRSMAAANLAIKLGIAADGSNGEVSSKYVGLCQISRTVGSDFDRALETYHPIDVAPFMIRENGEKKIGYVRVDAKSAKKNHVGDILSADTVNRLGLPAIEEVIQDAQNSMRYKKIAEARSGEIETHLPILHATAELLLNIRSGKESPNSVEIWANAFMKDLDKIPGRDFSAKEYVVSLAMLAGAAQSTHTVESIKDVVISHLDTDEGDEYGDEYLLKSCFDAVARGEVEYVSPENRTKGRRKPTIRDLLAIEGSRREQKSDDVYAIADALVYGAKGHTYNYGLGEKHIERIGDVNPKSRLGKYVENLAEKAAQAAEASLVKL